MTKPFVNWLENTMVKHGGRKYSQAALARDLNSSPATVSSWLTGKRPPDREHITLLARQFGVTSRYIYQLLGQNPPTDLNDDLERISGIVYRLGKKGLSKLLNDLEEGKYVEK